MIEILRGTKAMGDKCLKLIIKKLEQRWRHTGIFCINFEQISQLLFFGVCIIGFEQVNGG